MKDRGPTHEGRESRLPLSARVALVYLVVGAAWILVSDLALHALVLSERRRRDIGTAKGWLFAVASALLLFVYLRRVERERTGRTAAEMEAARQRQMFAGVVEQSPNAIVLLDEEARVTLWNVAAERIFGWREEEVLGGAVPYLTDEVQAALKGLMAQVLRGERVEVRGIPAVRRDGTEVVIAAAIGPIRDEDGDVVGFLGNVEDITLIAAAEGARDQALSDLEESERRYRLLFEDNVAPSWVFAIDSLRFLTVNRAAVVEYGYTNEEFLAMTLADIRPPEDVSLLHEALANRPPLHGSRVLPSVVRHRRKDGSFLDVEIRTTTIEWDGAEAALVTATDITQRLTVERDVAEKSRRLETLRALDRTVVGARNLEELASAMARRMRRIFPCDAVGLYVYDGTHARMIAGEPQGPPLSFPLVDARGVSLEVGEITRCDDLATLPPTELRDLALADGYRSHVLAPLVDGDRPFGHLYLASKQEAHFSDADAALVAGYTDELAVVVRHYLLWRELDSRNEELESLHALDRAIVASRDLRGMAGAAAEILRRATDATTGSVWLFEGDELVRTVVMGDRAADVAEGTRTRVDDVGIDLLPDVLRVRDLRGLPSSAIVRQRIEQGILSSLTVPVVVDDVAVSLISLASEEPDHFTERHEELARAVLEELQLGARHVIALESLSQQNAELEALNEERQRLLGRLVSAQEEERTRVARELHDSLGQTLTSLSLFAAQLERAEDPRVREEVRVLRHRLEDAVRETRGLVRTLRPTELDHGLGAALSHLLALSTEHTDIEGDVLDETGGRRFDDALETVAYRVVQEALTNAVRHASPSSISVLLTTPPGRLQVIVEDRGQGFNVSSSTDGFGLLSMRERAALVSGTLTLESVIGVGTTVRLEAPVS